MQPKILIVGAGPSGLSLALELAYLGIVPDIIDKKKSPSTLSRAVGIIPVTMDLLEASGAASQLRKEAVEVERALFYKDAKLLIDLELDILKDSNQRLFSLAQDRTETILSECLAKYGVKVNYSSCLEDLEQNETRINAIINGKEDFYDYVVGADGVYSQVRQSVGIKYSGFELEEDWSIADVYVKDEQFSRSFNVYFQNSNKITLLIPLEKNRLRIISNSANALETIPKELEICEIKKEASFKIGIKQALRYQEGRVFLVGDAAHCHSSVGGRGMNLGIADAIDLAHRFKNNDLGSYHKVRHKIGKDLIAGTEQARKLILSKNDFPRNLIFVLLKIVSKSNFLSKLFLKRVLLVANTV